MACFMREADLARPATARFALHDAIERGDASAVSALIAAFEQQLASGLGADSNDARRVSLDEKDPLGATPLHTSILFCNPDALRKLLLAGAKLDVKCSGSPPLHLAIAMACIPQNAASASASVKMLLAAGVDLNAVDDSGRTWLHAVADVGSVEIAETVAAEARGAPLPLESVDRSGTTPLGTAAAAKSEPVVRWLLARGASPDAANARGNTPVHIAAGEGWSVGVGLLSAASSKGSDPPRNHAGQTPAEAFVSHDLSTAKSLLLSHAACGQHQTSESTGRQAAYVPPENSLRLDVLLSSMNGTLRAAALAHVDVCMGAPEAKVGVLLVVL
jgi:ankyrin repeat protein